MKQNWITAIITDEFNDKTMKVTGKGHMSRTNAGAEHAVAEVYVAYLESQGVVFESYDDRDALMEKIAQSLRRYKTKAKSSGKATV